MGGITNKQSFLYLFLQDQGLDGVHCIAARQSFFRGGLQLQYKNKNTGTCLPLALWFPTDSIKYSVLSLQDRGLDGVHCPHNNGESN